MHIIVKYEVQTRIRYSNFVLAYYILNFQTLS